MISKPTTAWNQYHGLVLETFFASDMITTSIFLINLISPGNLDKMILCLFFLLIINIC